MYQFYSDFAIYFSHHYRRYSAAIVDLRSRFKCELYYHFPERHLPLIFWQCSLDTTSTEVWFSDAFSSQINSSKLRSYLKEITDREVGAKMRNLELQRAAESIEISMREYHPECGSLQQQKVRRSHKPTHPHKFPCCLVCMCESILQYFRFYNFPIVW